jgi:predicted nucleic acid-binding protein
MSAVGVVVADTTPLNYLILVGHADVLGSLFGEVLIPEAVLAELQHPNAPDAVTRWLRSPPAWLRVEKVRLADESLQLGKGETEAISLAIEREVKIVLMDERRGRAAAEARGLIAVGTLNLIDLADERRLFDGVGVLNALRQTTFRADSELLERFEVLMKSRRH